MTCKRQKLIHHHEENKGKIVWLFQNGHANDEITMMVAIQPDNNER